MAVPSLLWLALAPLALAGPVEKADRSLAAYQAGDVAALQKALDRARAAEQASPDDPAAWAVEGRVLLAVAGSPGAVQVEGDPAAQALHGFEKAVELGVSGGARAALEAKAPALESTLTAALNNLVEAKQWHDASAELDLASRAHQVSAALGHDDADTLVRLETLAVRVKANAGDAKAAEQHYQALAKASGRDDPGLAALVARKLAESGNVEGALAFLGPIVDAAPGDDVLLRAEVDLLVGAERPGDAVARVDDASDRLKTSVSGAYLAATLYDQAGDAVKARGMWAAVLALDPKHLDSHLALGRSLLVAATDLASDLGNGAGQLSYRERKQSEDMLSSEVDEALSHARAAVAIDGKNADALGLVVDAIARRLETAPKPVGKAAADLQAELGQAKDQLAALEKSG